MSKLDELDATIALIAAHRLIEYAVDNGAYTMRGADHYIERGLVTRALCMVLRLNIDTATRLDLKNAIAKFEVSLK